MEQDEVEVGCRTGVIHNITKNETNSCTAIPPHLLQLIEAGGLVKTLGKDLCV